METRAFKPAGTIPKLVCDKALRPQAGLTELLLLNFLMNTLVRPVQSRPNTLHGWHIRETRVGRADEQELALRMLRSKPRIEIADDIATDFANFIKVARSDMEPSVVVPFPISGKQSVAKLTDKIALVLALKLAVPMRRMLVSRDGSIGLLKRMRAKSATSCRRKAGLRVLLVADWCPDADDAETAHKHLASVGMDSWLVSWMAQPV